MKQFKKVLALVLAAVLLLGAAPQAAASEPLKWLDISVRADAALENTRIRAAAVGQSMTVFVPGSVDIRALPVYFTLSGEADITAAGSDGQEIAVRSGETLDLEALCGENGPYKVSFRAVAGVREAACDVEFVVTSRIDAMYLVSEDPENQGRTWVESSLDKSNKAKGSMVLTDASGAVVYDGGLSQIKGRGNSTWAGEKKPYQIKLDKKTDLLQTGDKANACKTWVLLANCFDPTMLRNALALDMGALTGLSSPIEYKFVDLFYDGEYRGLYLLTEKVQINSGRVEVRDLEEENEKANPGVELETLSTAQGITENGAVYYYCEGMQDPADITGGYLLEMEYAQRAPEEKCYFRTTRSSYVVVKSPEFASKAQMAYIAAMYQELEDALYNGGVNPDTGKYYTEYVDLPSVAQCYLVNEWSKNPDGFVSSAFLYKDTGSGKLYMGPVWDYDLAFGESTKSSAADAIEPEGWFTLHNHLMYQLYKQGDFRAAVKDLYLETVEPVVSRVLLGRDDSSSPLRAYSYYKELTARSAEANYRIWKVLNFTHENHPGGQTYASNLDFLENFLKSRSAWLKNQLETWNDQSYEPVSRFLDVDMNQWYAENVNRAAELGLLKGTGANYFEPKNPVTRAACVTALATLGGAPNGAAATADFTDVPAGSWYAPFVAWGQEEKLVAGYPDGTFRPNRNVTREEMISFLYRFLGSPQADESRLNEFSDRDKIQPYARQAMAWCIENGILFGYEDGTLRPGAVIPRSELAAFILRVYDYRQAQADRT